MARVSPFAKASHGRWRIVEMDNRDTDFLDLVAEAHLIFHGTTDGVITFGPLNGLLDVRYTARGGSGCAEFSWEGADRSAPAGSRGWAALGSAGRLVGHFYVHKGDASSFVCERDF
ncbi:hypothetical protein [Rhizobium grahamii]|uniref:Uncharacterized protein n=2 Tax=Rhizobium grahamii TaxID=1120045 RepID=S3I5D0_9HYPH|nr:hypothetical protein [Rhizobium grahamii]EPE94753.1 hypothetical protein RGCCGE502_29633 [Rhizobium grahamii CCGE 502]RDJ05550.1 hypothetical protein B5K06_24070 [Rhizobium grahamii]